MLIAVAGMILPIALGLTAVTLLMPELPIITDLYIAATLGASSVEITARVLRDIHKQQSAGARLIPGAA